MNKNLLDTSKPKSACLIADGEWVSAWQYEALNMAVRRGLISIDCLLICRNTSLQHDYVKHFGYYVIRTLMMTGPHLKKRRVQDLLASECRTIVFDAGVEGIWQRIPSATLDILAAEFDFDVAIKFGMGLLRDPDAFPAALGVLSYHHGDPSRFRGRPAGFYEVFQEASEAGAVVQKLSNRLDAGEMFAFGKFRLAGYSYAKTLRNLYAGSTHLLAKALERLFAGAPLPIDVGGTNYRLPSNAVAGKFLLRLLVRSLSRLCYGTFYEKKWQLGIAALSPHELEAGHTEIQQFSTLPSPDAFRFLADPFFDNRTGETIFCEAMDVNTGKGALLRIQPGKTEHVADICERTRHVSYPYTLAIRGCVYVIPEIAEHSCPKIYEVDPASGHIRSAEDLLGLEHERIIDPSIIEKDGKFWLFGGRVDTSFDQLCLWVADDLKGPYAEHVMSPIVLDPACARPGGRILEHGGTYYRFGQNNTKDYGNGITVCEIRTLTESCYAEVPYGTLTVRGFKGPHTVDFCGAEMIFDFYEEQFNPFAWLNRIKNKLL